MATWHTPKTWKPGDVYRNLTAAVLNYELRDLLQYLYDTLIGADYDTGWTAPTLLSAWVDTGGSEATSAYMKQGDWVHMRGSIEGDNSGSIAFTLPVGFRPSVRQRIAVNAFSPPGSLRIDTNGDVRVNDSNGAGTPVSGYVSLNGSFKLT